MTGITKQELKDYLDERLSVFATKEDIVGLATKDDIAEIKAVMATKYDIAGLATKEDAADIKQLQIRLNRKLSSHHDANTQHHLTTRAMIGDLNSQLTDLREGLSRAGDSLHQISGITTQ